MEALEHEETTTIAEEGRADKLATPEPQKPRADRNALAPPLIRTSRTMSYILRHGSKKEGLKMRPDGYVKVEDLLKLPKIRSIGFTELEKIVRDDKKGRYNLRFEPVPPNFREGEAIDCSVWWIRANQGHSMEDVEVEMTPVTAPSQCPVVIHGTSKRAWESIQKQGLSRMNRNHIHFAQGLPGTKGVISGMRSQADVMIYVDIAKALTDSYKFFISSNNVVLCAGNENGFLPPEYFLRVETAWKGYALPGYEGKRERTGKEKLKEHDEKHADNLKEMGIKPRRKFRWEDPVKDLLEGDSRKKKGDEGHSDGNEES